MLKRKRMPRSKRQAETLPANPWPALALAWLSAVVVALLAFRTLAVELSLPGHLRLDELRLFASTQGQPSSWAWMAALSPDPLRVHSRHSYCQAKLSQAVAANDFVSAQIARRECLAIVTQALAQSPANGRLWLEKAGLVFEISGPIAPVHESLAASWQTAPRAGWIALERLRFAARIWAFLPEESKARAALDAGLIATSQPMADAMAQEYASHPLVRPALAEIITQRLHDAPQRQLILALQRAAP